MLPGQLEVGRAVRGLLEQTRVHTVSHAITSLCHRRRVSWSLAGTNDGLTRFTNSRTRGRTVWALRNRREGSRRRVSRRRHDERAPDCGDTRVRVRNQQRPFRRTPDRLKRRVAPSGPVRPTSRWWSSAALPLCGNAPTGSGARALSNDLFISWPQIFRLLSLGRWLAGFSPAAECPRRSRRKSPKRSGIIRKQSVRQ